MQHVLSAGQFDKKDLLEILARTAEMKEILAKGGSEMGKGKILAALFYEPSTRTRLSFETAMLRLGGNVISETDVNFSSQAKGEALSDTIRVINTYADVIAMRSAVKGDAQIAADYSQIPVINGGDGAGEHPTQSLLDLFTISEHFTLDEPLTISFVGDCKHCRTIHSLTRILRNFDNVQINFVAPPQVQMPDEYITPNDKFYDTISDEVLAASDIVYTQRIQRERFADQDLAAELAHSFLFDLEKANKMPEKSIIMDPLPRINTIAFEVDNNPRAQYFPQTANGVPTRMALIARALNL